MATKPNSVPTPPDPSNFYLDQAPWPMAAVVGAALVVSYANPAFCRLLDKSKDEIVGKRFDRLLPDNDERVTILNRVFRTGNFANHLEPIDSSSQNSFRSYAIWPVLLNERVEGAMIQVSELPPTLERTRAMNEALLLGSIRQHELAAAAESSNSHLQIEIGERKHLEEELGRSQKLLSAHAQELERLVNERTSALKATNHQLETFVYSIAHDLRAPLRAMQGFSSMLLEDEGATLSETGRSYAHRINNSAVFMDALLIDLLEFSRISQQHLELAPVSLKMVVETVLSRLQKEIRDENARVESFGPWPAVLAQESILTQVVFNLVSNALKFIAPDVPPLVRLRAEEGAEFIRVWVEDNGIGIAPDHQAQVFRLFNRLHGERYHGTGIGLAIVEKGIERMGGRMGVESEVGRGSRFWFELRKVKDVPLAQTEIAAPPALHAPGIL